MYNLLTQFFRVRENSRSLRTTGKKQTCTGKGIQHALAKSNFSLILYMTADRLINKNNEVTQNLKISFSDEVGQSLKTKFESRIFSSTCISIVNIRISNLP